MRGFRGVSTAFVMAALAFFLFHLPAVIRGVQSGMTVAVTSVLPSLFFFAVIADLMISLTGSDLRPLNPKASVFLLGALCGFPVGAIACERMCTGGTLDRRDAARLLPFVNIASPAFLLGAVGSLFGDRRIGMLLLCAQLAAAGLCCLPLCIRKPRAAMLSEHSSPADAFFGAVERSISGMLRIMALICLFSALLSVLRDYVKNVTVLAALAVLLEVGNGSVQAAALFPASPCAAIVLCAFGCGFSGLCVHMQILSVLKSVKVKYIRFLLGKLLLGILTALFTFCGCKFILGY